MATGSIWTETIPRINNINSAHSTCEIDGVAGQTCDISYKIGDFLERKSTLMERIKILWDRKKRVWFKIKSLWHHKIYCKHPHTRVYSVSTLVECKNIYGNDISYYKWRFKCGQCDKEVVEKKPVKKWQKVRIVT